MAHRTIAFTGGLSKLPIINSHLVPEMATLLPPKSLMLSTNCALKERVREALIEDWFRLLPLPAYYLDPPALHLQLFMRLNKFMAGRIHRMRAGKSYQAGHPSWTTPEASTSCPHCGLDLRLLNTLSSHASQYTIPTHTSSTV